MGQSAYYPPLLLMGLWLDTLAEAGVLQSKPSHTHALDAYINVESHLLLLVVLSESQPYRVSLFGVFIEYLSEEYSY